MELKRLKIDEEFRHLIRPLRHREFLQLEQNIINDGCRDPIVVWHDTIVDGHNRYEICMRHSIPFDTKDMEFECQSAWQKKHHRRDSQVPYWYAVRE